MVQSASFELSSLLSSSIGSLAWHGNIDYMYYRSCIRLSSLHSRRRWEQRIASVLSEHKEEHVDAAAKRFNRIYRDRQYTTVEEAFPLLDKARWAGVVARSSVPPTSPLSSVSQPADTRVLRATIVGPQNVGKTSLVNALALSHVGAVSNRYGCTKDWTKAIATLHNTQLQLLDTPGVVVINNDADRKRHASSSARTWDSFYVADLVLLALPAGLGFVDPEHKRISREVVQRAAARDLPVVLAVTMMDRVQTPKHREFYFAMRTDFESMGLPLTATQEVSVKDGSGLVALKDFLCGYATPGPWEYARHESTDLSPVDRVSEMLRQVYFELLPHEMPHEMQQRIIGWTAKESGTTEVAVEVFFDRPAYMFTFYAKLEAICARAQLVTERELKKRYRFVFQAFTSPGGMATR